MSAELAVPTGSRKGAVAGASGASHPARPGRVDRGQFAILALGFAILYIPTLWSWLQGTWAQETQGHEPVILAASAWLLYRQRHLLTRLPAARTPAYGNALIAFALAVYVVGRSQQILRLELLSLTLLLAGLLLHYKGRAGIARAWFPLAFQLFALPLPFELVLALTGPLKTGASATATWMLSSMGYPVGRSGVVMTVGQYQLLVTEACAGLQTMFTLEAMGLLYASLMHRDDARRNAILALLVLPVSFIANVVRVMALALVTYHFGDAAGQGFLHGFAGVLLFLVALVLIVAIDGLLGRLLPRRRLR